MNAPPPPPPPPPPPHGAHQGNKNGLPDGHYDIFIIPPHSSGGGFLYLPSLQPHRNSFLAGFGSAIVLVTIYSIVVPVLKEWTSSIVAGGGFSVIVLLLIVGVSGWAWGKTQMEGGFTNSFGSGNNAGGPQAHASGQPAGGGAYTAPPPPPPPQPPPKPTWSRPTGAGAANGTANAGAAKGGWEKAREETRKKEEERKKAEEARKKKEKDEKDRIAQREKDAREREARERREKATSGRPASPTKNHRQPRADTATDDDAYSFRPYDNPRKPAYSATASSVYSESSYTPSHSTSRTTPPPSHRGPYVCKDPNKIVLKAVYAFNNVYMKSPIAKLVSGMGAVTDGLILRITTEGLFIDDDVRGVPQREWDVKAWTLKLVEVFSLPSSSSIFSSYCGSSIGSRRPPSPTTLTPFPPPPPLPPPQPTWLLTIFLRAANTNPTTSSEPPSATPKANATSSSCKKKKAGKSPLACSVCAVEPRSGLWA